jgi:hypothetical protein
MNYNRTTWVEPAFVPATRNLFDKSDETPSQIRLTPAETYSNDPTKFRAAYMNNLEQGLADAAAEINGIQDLMVHSDMAETGRNLLTVLGVQSIQAAMAALHTRCNGTGTPNFRGLMIGDYLDGIDLSAIPAENGGTAGQAWNNTYKNNRIVLSGFNTYMGSGDGAGTTKNHLLFTFRNIPLKKRMNPTNDNTGGYPASEMRAFLEGANGDGTGDYAGSTTVTTAAFLNALKAQIGASYILPVRRSLSTKPASGAARDWFSCSLFLASEHEVFGESNWGDPVYDDGLKIQFPIYQKASTYRCKKYNNARDWHFECSPYSGFAAYFCVVHLYGSAYHYAASTVGGCSPAFCAA